MMSSTMLLAALAFAASGDSRWDPFLGCWTLVHDEVRRPLLLEDETEPPEDGPSGLVCLAPSGEGVQVRTFSDDEAFLESMLVADGTRREVSEGKCRGWQELHWSEDGRRLFTRSELACDEGPPRSLTGISLLTDAGTWLEIQSIGSGEVRSVVTRRYRPASEEVSLLRSPQLTAERLRQAESSRAETGSSRIGIDEVIEAASRVEPEVVEAMLLERGGGFPLDAASLVRLSDASVSPRIIDLMVAMSFPDRFEVDREASSPGGSGLGFSPFSGFFDPLLSAYPYYFAPFGAYSWYAPWHPVYVVPPIDSPGASVGRLVEGRGYTRITPILPDGGSGGRRARQRGSSGDGGSDWSSGSSQGGSSSGTASPQGYSRGGAQGRSAKPKKN